MYRLMEGYPIVAKALALSRDGASSMHNEVEDGVHRVVEVTRHKAMGEALSICSGRNH
jgi:uncharacterized protein (UPF0276 family)